MALSIEPPRISHSKSTCRARFLDRCLAAMKCVALQANDQICELNSDFGSFSALVSALSAGAVHSLLHVVGCENTECDGHASLETHLVQSVSRATRNKLKMRGVAANHCSQRNQRIALWRQRLGRDG